jgi:hypothetical protein
MEDLGERAGDVHATYASSRNSKKQRAGAPKSV